eukprot:g13585.t1
MVVPGSRQEVHLWSLKPMMRNCDKMKVQIRDAAAARAKYSSLEWSQDWKGFESSSMSCAALAVLTASCAPLGLWLAAIAWK